MRYNGGLQTIVKLIINNSDNWHNVIKKIVATYGIGAALFLIRMVRRDKPLLHAWFRNMTAFSALHFYPLLLNSRLLGSNQQLTWCILIACTLKISDQLPDWIPSYLTVEAIFDYLRKKPVSQKFSLNLDETSLLRVRQLSFCALIPLLYSTTHGKKWFFGKDSLVRDFAIFYSISNLMSIYRYCKSLVNIKRKSDAPSPRLITPNDEWPLVSTSLKPLMNKLTELQELEISNKHTFLEVLMDSALVRNLIPCLKWTIWRTFCIKVLSQVKLGHTRIMKSLVLMIGFLVLDHDQHMDISPPILKYLVSCQVKEFLKKTGDFKKLLTFASSNLALYITH